MGLREAVLLLFGFELLFSGGNFCSATQNFTTDETLNQTQQTTGDRETAPETADHPSNQTEEEDPARPPPPPVSYRLRSFQLQSPAVGSDEQNLLRPLVELVQAFQNLQRSEAAELTSEAVEAQEMLIQGPDLSQAVKEEPKVVVKFEEREPVSADSVSVRCGEGEVIVEVKQNFLGNGQLIRPSDLTLGGCAAVDAADHVVQFHTELHGCGSSMMMTEEALIYSFTLMYSPTPISNTFIFKTNPAEVLIQCHYQRRHYVSSDAVLPTWKPFSSSSSSMQAEQQLHFSLRLLTEDWQSQRPSTVYFLSDVMHIEASVHQGHHVPLRVYVDSCVATMNPDPYSQPRYPFISNHGCLTDGKLTGAKSYFMPRSQEDKLHFQLKAFSFHRDDRNSFYITCRLKATTLSVPIDPQHKACSFLTEAKRWVASGGDNEVCSCCETSCSEQRWRRSLAADLQWEGTAALGPVLLEDRVLQEELAELSRLLLPDPLQTHDVAQTASYSSVALLGGVGAALAVVLLVFMGAVICSRIGKPTEYSVCT